MSQRLSFCSFFPFLVLFNYTVYYLCIVHYSCVDGTEKDTNYTEAATNHELCYYYYITMDELLNPETDERLVLYVCMIPG